MAPFTRKARPRVVERPRKKGAAPSAAYACRAQSTQPAARKGSQTPAHVLQHIVTQMGMRAALAPGVPGAKCRTRACCPCRGPRMHGPWPGWPTSVGRACCRRCLHARLQHVERVHREPGHGAGKPARCPQRHRSVAAVWPLHQLPAPVAGARRGAQPGRSREGKSKQAKLPGWPPWQAGRHVFVGTSPQAAPHLAAS